MAVNCSLIVGRDRVLLIALCARLIRLRSAANDRDERNAIDCELNAVRRVLGG